MVNVKRFVATWRIVLAIVITFLIFGVIAGGLQAFGKFDDMLTNYVWMQSMFALVGALNTFALLVLYQRVNRKNPMQLGFLLNRKHMVFSLFCVIITLFTVVGFVIILDLQNKVSITFEWETFLTANFIKFLFIGMVGWFLAALKEEVLARGYFMANLNSFGFWKMLFISSFLFMAMHFVTNGFDVMKAGSWFLGGIVYGYIYLKSGSLIVSTIVHAAHNQLNDLVIHGSEAAFIWLDATVSLSDKLAYEFVLSALLILLTNVMYGKNGWVTPAENLQTLWQSEVRETRSDTTTVVL